MGVPEVRSKQSLRGRIGRRARAVRIFAQPRLWPRVTYQVQGGALLKPWPRSGSPPVSSARMHMQTLDAVRRAVRLLPHRWGFCRMPPHRVLTLTLNPTILQGCASGVVTQQGPSWICTIRLPQFRLLATPPLECHAAWWYTHPRPHRGEEKEHPQCPE